MKKFFKFFQNLIVIKCLSAVLLFSVLAGSICLLKSTSNKVLLKQKDNSVLIKKYLDKADVYFDAYENDSAFYYFNKAQSICNTKTDYVDYVYALTCIATIEQSKGDFIASELTLTKTLPYLKKIKKPRFASNVYMQLAANYYYTYDFHRSLIYLKKALQLKSSTYRKIIVLNSISLNYIAQKNYKKAENILIPLSKIKVLFQKDKKTNDNEYSRILDNLGLCYYAQEKPEAIYYFQKSLTIKLKLKDYNGLIYNYKHLASYFQKSNPKLSKKYAYQAYIISSKLNDISNRIKSLNLLINSSEGNDLKKYSLKYVELVDNITKANQTAKNQSALIKYDSQKDKKENLLLKTQQIENDLQIERQKSKIIISYVILVFVLSFLLFLSFYLTSKGKKEKTDAILKSEIRISKKLHDELANDVYQTIAFAETKDLEKEDNKEKLLNNLDSIYFRTRNISKENSNISTDKSYPLAVKEMISAYKSPGINILINGFDAIRWNKIEKNKKIILYRVLQELFVNMTNHSEASLASISFNIKNKNLQVIYIDNGVGIKNNTLILKNGLQNVENRIKTINGTIIFGNNSQKGFKISFTFPL